MGVEQRRIAIAIAMALSAAACSGSSTRATTPAVSVAGLVLPALDGGEIRLGAYRRAAGRGKVIVLHLFTTWSVASQVDVEKLNALHDKAGANVVVVGVALDPDGYRLVSPWRKAMTPHYLIALATNSLRNGKSVLGRIRSVPTTLIVDGSGRVRRRIERQLAHQELPRAVEAARQPR